MKFISVLVTLTILVCLLYEDARFVIGDNDQVVITQFGKVAGPAYKIPGEYFKLPFIQKANYFRNNQFLSKIEQEIPTKEYEIVLYSSRIYYEIIDPIKYYQNLNSYKLAQDYIFDCVGHWERTIVTSHELSGLIIPEEPDDEGNFKCQHEVEHKIKVLSQPKLNYFGINLVGYEAKIHNTGRRIVPNRIAG